jgi:hypothetical protein
VNLLIILKKASFHRLVISCDYRYSILAIKLPGDGNNDRKQQKEYTMKKSLAVITALCLTSLSGLSQATPLSSSGSVQVYNQSGETLDFVCFTLKDEIQNNSRGKKRPWSILNFLIKPGHPMTCQFTDVQGNSKGSATIAKLTQPDASGNDYTVTLNSVPFKILNNATKAIYSDGTAYPLKSSDDVLVDVEPQA